MTDIEIGVLIILVAVVGDILWRARCFLKKRKI